MAAAGLTAAVVAAVGSYAMSASDEALDEVVEAVRTQADGDPRDEAGRRDGRIAEESILIDDDHPAISGLDRRLRQAVRSAARAAEASSIEIRVTSGWRSARYQRELLAEAIEEYGSREEALKWVQTPRGSSHTKGAGIDVGPPEAAAWLDREGADFGLCRTYANEDWHFELAARADGTCPPLLEDSSS